MSGRLWEDLWADTDSASIFPYLERFYKLKSGVMDIFKDSGAVRVCDAACGYGAYSVALASNGFEVYSFDVSPSAAAVTRAGLERYGLDSSRVRTADILATGYPDEFFDGTVAGSVLDHMGVRDAKRALFELRRVTKPGGVIMVSFDEADEDDLALPHELLPDGSILYTSGRRRGMILHPYNEADGLLEGLKILYTDTGPQGERVFVFKNP